MTNAPSITPYGHQRPAWGEVGHEWSHYCRTGLCQSVEPQDGTPRSVVDQGQSRGKNVASGVQHYCLLAGDPALGPRVQGGPGVL